LGVVSLIAAMAVVGVTQANGAEKAGSAADPADRAEAGRLVTEATKAVEGYRDGEVGGTFRAAVAKARAVLIVPQFERAGFGLGGEGGAGVLLTKLPGAAGWTYPAFFEVGGPTLGAQIGFETGALVIVIHNQQTLNEIMDGELAFGAEARAVAGSKGVAAQTTTTGGDKIDLFFRSSGVFAGAILKGGEIRPVRKFNAAYYPNPAEPEDILKATGPKNPHADGLRAALSGLMAPPKPMPIN
jgi:lipid-binding SYLF domain-containing protein